LPVEAQRREPWDRRGETHDAFGCFGVGYGVRSLVRLLASGIHAHRLAQRFSGRVSVTCYSVWMTGIAALAHLGCARGCV